MPLKKEGEQWARAYSGTPYPREESEGFNLPWTLERLRYMCPSRPAGELDRCQLYGSIGYTDEEVIMELAKDIDKAMSLLDSPPPWRIVWEQEPKVEPYVTEAHRGGRLRVCSAKFAIESIPEGEK